MKYRHFIVIISWCIIPLAIQPMKKEELPAPLSLAVPMQPPLPIDKKEPLRNNADTAKLITALCTRTYISLSEAIMSGLLYVQGTNSTDAEIVYHDYRDSAIVYKTALITALSALQKEFACYISALTQPNSMGENPVKKAERNLSINPLGLSLDDEKAYQSARLTRFLCNWDLKNLQKEKKEGCTKETWCPENQKAYTQAKQKVATVSLHRELFKLALMSHNPFLINSYSTKELHTSPFMPFKSIMDQKQCYAIMKKLANDDTEVFSESAAPELKEKLLPTHSRNCHIQ